MKKVLIAAVIGGAFLALRRFGPGFAQRAMAKCHEMMERGPARA